MTLIVRNCGGSLKAVRHTLFGIERYCDGQEPSSATPTKRDAGSEDRIGYPSPNASGRA
jgi:hypothetical protein